MVVQDGYYDRASEPDERDDDGGIHDGRAYTGYSARATVIATVWSLIVETCAPPHDAYLERRLSESATIGRRKGAEGSKFLVGSSIRGNRCRPRAHAGVIFFGQVDYSKCSKRFDTPIALG